MKIIDTFKKWWVVIIKCLQDWSDAWALIPAVLIVLFFGPIIHLFDKTAGSPDPGYLSKFLLALVFILATHAFTWIGIKLNYPTIFKYSDNGFYQDWLNLTSWQRICIYFCVPAFLLLLFVALIITL